MEIYIGNLRKGDVIIMSKGKSASSGLFNHAAIISQIHKGLRPYILELTGFGFERSLYMPNTGCDYVYRLKCADGEVTAGKAATAGNIWVTSYPNTKYRGNTHTLNSGVYNTSSVFTSYFGNSSYGIKAMRYAEYLYENCQCNPPRELNRSASFFSGAICTYLPIALYQTVMGGLGCIGKMEIDARKSLPRDLARYLDNNELWACCGTVTERST
ncbi:hypothetical protein [Endozoicomonas euniceicola]|uniref:Amidase domain-containing protein n=1 Tax=Endozoicomonas euniceicola TaxID=1234143 RepID=A0ABY6GX29_9GAMM|nr:hypothetical protein [Endozoicomonas euniceicola]UYM17220.1 hypothetical protein NX720_04660 [Endozoicomonas euniceicola]